MVVSGMKTNMRRREFLGLVGGMAAAWPLDSYTQERVRRVGVLTNLRPDDAEIQSRLAVFAKGLEQLGWTVGRNLRIDYRWSGNDRTRLNQHAMELISLGPDVVLAGTGGTTPVLRHVSSTVPIVFAQNIDPIGAGDIASLSRPGTNATGFTQFEYTLSAKWLELLREIAPGLTRAAVVRDAEGSVGIGQWAVIQAAAGPLGVELTPIDPLDIREMQRAVSALAQIGNSGLIVAVSSAALNHSEQIRRRSRRATSCLPSIPTVTLLRVAAWSPMEWM